MPTLGSQVVLSMRDGVSATFAPMQQVISISGFEVPVGVTDHVHLGSTIVGKFATIPDPGEVSVEQYFDDDEFDRITEEKGKNQAFRVAFGTDNYYFGGIVLDCVPDVSGNQELSTMSTTIQMTTEVSDQEPQ